jgi:hypothetical protein
VVGNAVDSFQRFADVTIESYLPWQIGQASISAKQWA